MKSIIACLVKISPMKCHAHLWVEKYSGKKQTSTVEEWEKLHKSGQPPQFKCCGSLCNYFGLQKKVRNTNHVLSRVIWAHICSEYHLFHGSWESTCLMRLDWYNLKIKLAENTYMGVLMFGLLFILRYVSWFSSVRGFIHFLEPSEFISAHHSLHARAESSACTNSSWLGDLRIRHWLLPHLFHVAVELC